MEATEQIDQLSEQYDVPFVVLDGFEDAIVGVGEQVGGKPALIYDYEQCVEILMDRDDMEKTEAVEFLEHNTINVHYSDEAANPIFRYPIRT